MAIYFNRQISQRFLAKNQRIYCKYLSSLHFQMPIQIMLTTIGIDLKMVCEMTQIFHWHTVYVLELELRVES